MTDTSAACCRWRFLAPDIVEAIARGNQPTDLTAHRLIRNLDLPIEWAAQKQVLGFA